MTRTAKTPAEIRATMRDMIRTRTTDQLVEMVDILDAKPHPERFSLEVTETITAVTDVLGERVIAAGRDDVAGEWWAYGDTLPSGLGDTYRLMLGWDVPGFDVTAAIAVRDAKREQCHAETEERRAAAGMEPERTAYGVRVRDDAPAAAGRGSVLVTFHTIEDARSFVARNTMADRLEVFPVLL